MCSLPFSSSDEALLADTIPAMKLYFSTFIFMVLQYVGQTTFKSLNKHRQAVFFSLLRKGVYCCSADLSFALCAWHGTDGVFMAEPVSNVLGGCACFFAMLATVLPELKQMEKVNAEPKQF